MLGENRVTIKAISQTGKGAERIAKRMRGNTAYIAACFFSSAILNKYAKIDKLHIGV
ncbi:MAG: hypothetical protein KIG71_05645 [Eubacteriales bacterium]|nr:hypothetical protein [Eubacteriales bacterium]